MYDDGPTDEHYSFTFADPRQPELLELKTRYRHEELAAGSTSNLEKVHRLCAWVHGLWGYDGWNEPFAPDALTILEEAATGKKFRCTEYSIVITASANSLGLPSRIVGLLTEDSETREFGASHVVSEIFLPDQGYWMTADGQWNVIPMCEGKPLNALELRQAIDQGGAVTNALAASNTAMEDYIEWVDEYLYCLMTWLDGRQTELFEGEKLALLPQGAQERTVFQQRHPVLNTTFTRSARAFYPEP